MSVADEELTISLILPLLAVAIYSVRMVRKRVVYYATSRCVEHISAMIVAKEEPSDEEIRSLRTKFTKGVIDDAVVYISDHISGRSLNRLSLIMEVCEVAYTSIFHKRFGEIATLIEAYPDRAIRYIARLDYSLSWYDVALLVQLMRTLFQYYIYYI